MFLLGRCVTSVLRTNILRNQGLCAGVVPFHTSAVDNKFYVPGYLGDRFYVPDVISKMLERRIIVVEGQVNDALSESVVAQLLYLEMKDADSPIKMVINSPGGAARSQQTVIDCMSTVKPQIITHCVGRAFSAGCTLLVCGDKRYATTHSRLMIHTAMLGGDQGLKKVEKLKESISSLHGLNASMIELFAKQTGRSEVFIGKKMYSETYLTAAEAIDFGIIHNINNSIMDFD